MLSRSRAQATDGYREGGYTVGVYTQAGTLIREKEIVRQVII